MKLSHVPLRLATGAFILNSGLNKRNLPPEAAAGLQGMATNAVPQAGDMDPESFGKALSKGEIALGAALLAPFVPSAIAGAALTAFGGGMIKMYLSTPGMTAEGSSFRPSQDGTAIAKDIWLVGAGLSLLISGLTPKKPLIGK
ncbi:hypothetical protein H1W00_13955 [Aeromicrobium sp. Marseille-Q0843]|uniref:DoxX family membrane protein n=1 Tax=Aeromicrobium phoceense TaxID=2754045 RepID=A0A838XLU2_9ACTN|nr:hypothetical protein [Aeromicrobium phoceense]MBA4609586.1 hypothetical protein [Aeromicrobium phoceense]